MKRRPPRSTRNDTPFPYTTLFRSNRYHKPGDEYSEDWNLEGVVQDLQALYGVGRVLVDGDQWPNWYEGNAFRAARDEMMAGNGDDASDGDQQEPGTDRSEEHTSELQSLMRNSYAVFCLKNKNERRKTHN